MYRDRDQFASLVREVAAPDVGRMGIEILSFTIKGNVYQTYFHGYEAFEKYHVFGSLGKCRKFIN